MINKPKYIVEEIKIETKNFDPVVKRTDVCPECRSLFVVRQYGLHEEAACAGCGYTETTQPRQPVDI